MDEQNSMEDAAMLAGGRQNVGRVTGTRDGRTFVRRTSTLHRRNDQTSAVRRRADRPHQLRTGPAGRASGQRRVGPCPRRPVQGSGGPAVGAGRGGPGAGGAVNTRALA